METYQIITAMTEHVFRPSRLVNGKRKRSKLYSGRYSLGRGQKVKTVGLQTPDEAVARVRLREIIVHAQRVAAGLPASKAPDAVAIAPWLGRYHTHLGAMGYREKHVDATVRRVRCCLQVTGWQIFSEVTADRFIGWLGTVKGAVKTRKEYETSVHAFMNWAVQAGVLESNPLASVKKINARGRQSKPTRAYTEEELRRLFALRTERSLAYQVFTYTGLRKSELKGLLWDDVDFRGESPHIRLRETGTKDKADRVVPLHPVAVAAFRRIAREDGVNAKPRIFEGRFPSWEAFKRDLAAAGIERKDSANRVVNFQAFRKTFQTLGARHGLHQRSAQEVLGHSDANLTAKAYTDAAALILRPEVLKLPDLTVNAAGDAQKAGKPAVLGALVERLKTLVTEVVAEVKGSREMVVGEGFEPS